MLYFYHWQYQKKDEFIIILDPRTNSTVSPASRRSTYPSSASVACFSTLTVASPPFKSIYRCQIPLKDRLSVNFLFFCGVSPVAHFFGRSCCFEEFLTMISRFGCWQERWVLCSIGSTEILTSSPYLQGWSLKIQECCFPCISAWRN